MVREQQTIQAATAAERAAATRLLGPSFLAAAAEQQRSLARQQVSTRTRKKW